MTLFEMIKYHGQQYPSDIPLRIEEIAAHFDVTRINSTLAYSLHTEYSYMKRSFSSPLLSQSPTILSSNKDGIPQLWTSMYWASEFSKFTVRLVGSAPPPKVIEIHPPFQDYTNIDDFIINYSIYESIIKSIYPDVEILIENRCGSRYRGAKFLISTVPDLLMLCELIEKNNLSLKIALDIPQIFTAYHAKTEKDYFEILLQTREFRQYIGGIHLWGKAYSANGKRIAHQGDLNTYFQTTDIKSSFLALFRDIFSDNMVRKMVLEVNSNNRDLYSIIHDLQSVDIQFV